MTLAEIQSNEELRRHEFPVTRNKVFLAHAGVCPLPRRVAAAIQLHAEKGTQDDQETPVAHALLSDARAAAAALLQAQPEEIAFVGPTSLALSFVAGGLRFRKSDNVVVYLDDYPANVYPWMALADRGVEVRFLNVRELGCIRPIDVLGQIDEATRLVALASCHFVAGWRIDWNAIGSALRQRGILFCVDAIQTLGAFPMTVENIDFLAADAHKWLLGPCAAGILYVRREVQTELNPVAFGWNNVRCPDFVAQERITLRNGARRYEAGTYNLLGLAGLHAGIELLREMGLESVGQELLRKRSWFVPALQAQGYTVLQANASPANAGGIITCFRPGTDLAALEQRLSEHQIRVSRRADRIGQQYLRFSPHFYNTDRELEQVLELLG